MLPNHGLRIRPRQSPGRCTPYPLKPCVFVVFCSSHSFLPKPVCCWTLWIYPDQSACCNMPSISAARWEMSHQGSSCFRVQRTSIRRSDRATEIVGRLLPLHFTPLRSPATLRPPVLAFGVFGS